MSRMKGIQSYSLLGLAASVPVLPPKWARKCGTRLRQPLHLMFLIRCLKDASSFPDYRNRWSRWALHYNPIVLVLFKTATCIIYTHWCPTRLNEMHLGLRPLAVVHSTLLSTILTPGRDSCKAEAPQGGYECSCGRLTPARNHSPCLQLSVTAPYCCRLLSSVFQAQIESKWPNHRQKGREGTQGGKGRESTPISSWHWWTEVDFVGWNQPIKVRFFSPP